MNRQTKFLILAGMVALVAGAIFWWFRNAPATEASSTANQIQTPRANPGVSSDPPPSLATPPQAAPQQRQIEGSKFGGLATLSAAPIEFYGKVIDQDSKPLPAVEVVGRTGSKTGFMQEERRSYVTATDARGRFTFSGFKGDGLVIELKKPGYNFDSERRQFLYSPIDPDKKRFKPDRDNAVVFQMWKSLGLEPLIHYQEFLGETPSDGMPIQIDLSKGKLVKEGGDLVVSVKWGARTEASSYLFDWSATLSVPTGGILEGGSDVMFVAPTEGYKESLDYHFAGAERQVQLRRTFYVVSRNRQTYSRVELSLQNQPGRSATTVNVRVWLNPKAGSRNLEPGLTAQTPAR